MHQWGFEQAGPGLWRRTEPNLNCVTYITTPDPDVYDVETRPMRGETQSWNNLSFNELQRLLVTTSSCIGAID
jgi:hypothetical protein